MPLHMRLPRLLGTILALGAAAPAVAQGDVAAQPTAASTLTYFEPGNILPRSSLGIKSRKVWFPRWSFPLDAGAASGRHAYMGTQLSAYHGVDWVNDPRLFSYPHRDNQCEPRDWTMQPCPAGKGHQGVDIRAHDNQNNVWPVLAVEDGVVTSVTRSTTVIVRNGTHSVRYLHMDHDSIAAAGIRPGVNVVQGQRLGKVSCILGARCQTSRHLHLDAYTGSAGAGNFYHVYPSLISAYRRAWRLPDSVTNGELAPDAGHEVGTGSAPPDPASPSPPAPPPDLSCANVALGETPATVDRDQFVSLWRHNCSVLGLIADENSGRRSFVYFRPKHSLAGVVASDPVLFEGTNTGGHFTGIAKAYSSHCGSLRFRAEGTSSTEGGIPGVEVRGVRDRLDSQCQKIGSHEEVLHFTYVEQLIRQPTSQDHVIPHPRVSFSEFTRNFLAITFYPQGDGQIQLLPYFADFPGYTPEGGKTDSTGGLIPALASDEAGVAISWVWIRKRAQFTQGLVVTPRSVAHSMAGVEPGACDTQLNPTAGGILAAGNDEARARRLCGRVSAYARGYVGFGGGRGFATDYFARQVGMDETLNLADPVTAWNWMRTMYSHESGRAPVIGREAFERGTRLGNDYITYYYDGAPADTVRPLAFYSDPCNFSQPSCGGVPVTVAQDGGAAPDSDALSQILQELANFRSRLESLERIVSSMSEQDAD